MSALLGLLVTVGLIALLLYLLRRWRAPLVAGALWLGLLAIWLSCAFVTVALALWAMSPPGIGVDDWPELWVNLAVTIGLPLALLVRWLTGGPGDGRDSQEDS
jgi:hypothetical protein